MARGPQIRKHMSVSLPAALVDEVREAIEKDESQFYTSVPDFIKDAVRRLLEERDLKRRAGALGDKLDALKPDADRAGAKLRPAFCHKCGAPLVPGALFCSSCRTKVG